MTQTDKQTRARVGFFAGLFGILTNLVAFAVKLAVGLISGSVSVAADAVNSLTDAGSSILTMIGFRLSAKPADRDHPYGHARYEQITSLLIAVIMLAVGLIFAKSSVEKIIKPVEITVGILTECALFAAVLLKIAQAFVYLKMSKKIDSQTLHTAALDSRNDVLMTLAVLVSVIVMDIFDVNIDGWAGLAVSLFIVCSAASAVRSAISPMLGAAPPESLVNSILEIVKSRPGILGCHDLIIHNYGSGTNYASLHAEVDPSGSLIEVHSMVDGIEREVLEKLGIVLTIHIDPTERGGQSGEEI